MKTNNASAKNILSIFLIIVGGIGYIFAAYFVCMAIYFWIVAELHPNAPEDQAAGLAGLGFVLQAGAGIVIGSVASIFFFPGIILRSRIKKLP